MTIGKYERSTKDLARAVVSGWLGTVLEFMDFQLYSLGAVLVLHEMFLPGSSTAVVLILAMGTYGAGCMARIVGAFIFGKVGDRVGRKRVLFITITMMGICAALISVLPIYTQIGVLAPILLVTLRVIQGLDVSAEISSAGTMLAEYVPKGKRGIVSSPVTMRTDRGTLNATVIWAFVFFILSKEGLLAQGWRIPFLVSVVVMVFAIWLYMNLKENPVFGKVSDSSQPTTRPAPAGSMLQSKSFWLATGLRFGQAGNSGLVQTFLAGYLVQALSFNKAAPTDTLMISSILGFMAIPSLGQLFDKIGRRVPYIITSTSIIVLVWPMLSITVDKSYAPSTIVVTLIAIHNCAVLGLFVLENITMAEMFGCKNRFTRITISEKIDGPTASGFGPILAGTFCTVTESWYPITIMVTAYSVISSVSALKIPEVKDRDLSALEGAVEDQPHVVRAAQPSKSL